MQAQEVCDAKGSPTQLESKSSEVSGRDRERALVRMLAHCSVAGT